MSHGEAVGRHRDRGYGNQFENLSTVDLAVPNSESGHLAMI